MNCPASREPRGALRSTRDRHLKKESERRTEDATGQLSSSAVDNFRSNDRIRH